MGKLTLEIESLKVESFEAGDEQRRWAPHHGTFYETCGCTPTCDTVEPYC